MHARMLLVLVACALLALLQAGKLMCRGIYPLSTDTPYIYLYTAGSAVTHMSS